MRLTLRMRLTRRMLRTRRITPAGSGQRARGVPALIEQRLVFDASAYSADSIQRAAYRFSDRLAIDLSQSGGEFLCTVLISDEFSSSADEIAIEFRNEVLDQVLRERIRGETEGVRNVILALAFSNTGLTESRE